MTSEVLILNKRAIILGADSAVTTSGGDHPRYSKTANKIFEVSKNGRVAAAIYGNASIDYVPWELVLKMFREHLGDVTFPQLKDYTKALCDYISGNEKLFPAHIRNKVAENQFDDAIKDIIQSARNGSPDFCDLKFSLEDRQSLWAKEAARLKQGLLNVGVQAPLTEAALGEVLKDLDPWIIRAQNQLDEVPTFSAVNAADLAELGHLSRYTIPHLLFSNTGVVIAGYGEDQIFPAFEQMQIFGNIGGEIFYKKEEEFKVTHDGIAMIQPLAQSSMIEMFTEGFSRSLTQIIEQQSSKALENVFLQLANEGVNIPYDLVARVSLSFKSQFEEKWKRDNWRVNFYPLLSVLQSLSVQEMAHLAESLLSLESLKERVTSPSESVGGPIDVAAITKSEGLVWIRRKHYFDPTLNMRYAARLERSFD